MCKTDKWWCLTVEYNSKRKARIYRKDYEGAKALYRMYHDRYKKAKVSLAEVEKAKDIIKYDGFNSNVWHVLIVRYADDKYDIIYDRDAAFIDKEAKSYAELWPKSEQMILKTENF